MSNDISVAGPSSIQIGRVCVTQTENINDSPQLKKPRSWDHVSMSVNCVYLIRFFFVLPRSSRSSFINKLPEFVAVTLLTVLFSIASCKAYLVDDPLRHFFFAHVGSDELIVSWDTSESKVIPYERGGDISFAVSRVIDRYADMFYSAGIKLVRDINPKVVFLYQKSIFDDLINRPEKLKSIGFSDDIIAKLKFAYDQNPKMNCLSQLETDKQGNISGAVVLSKTENEDCAREYVYNTIGVNKVADDAEGLGYVCLLYKARQRGYRTGKSFNEHSRDLAKECLPSLAP